MPVPEYPDIDPCPAPPTQDPRDLIDRDTQIAALTSSDDDDGGDDD